MKFLMQGNKANPEQVLRDAMFKEDSNEKVMVKDI